MLGLEPDDWPAVSALLDQAMELNARTRTVLGRYVFGRLFAFAMWRWQGQPRVTRDMVPAHLSRDILLAA